MIDPGQPGFDENRFLSRLMNWGMQFIYSTGQVGLQLYNALRRRWPGSDVSQLSRWSRFLGNAARAGVALTQGDPGQIMGIGNFPLAGGSIWNEEPGSRWRIVAEITGTNALTGEPMYRTVNLFGTAPKTIADLLDDAFDRNQSANDRYMAGEGRGAPLIPSQVRFLSAVAAY